MAREKMKWSQIRFSTLEEDKNRYHTLRGMMMWLLGHMPRTGDMTVWNSGDSKW